MSSVDYVKGLVLSWHNSNLIIISRIIMYRFKRDFGGQKLKDPPSGHLGAKPSLNLKMYPI